jgi:hypothetical protein
MRRLPVCLALVLSAASSAALLAATDVNLSVPIFARTMSSDLWNDVDSQAGFGATVDFGRHGSPFHFQAGLQSSTATKTFSDPLVNDTRGAISEIFFGIAKVWEPKGPTRPYISGGASFVHATLEKNVLSGSGSVIKDDDSLGFYVEGGVYWRLSHHFNFGLMGRYLGGTSISLFGADGNADYWEAGPMLGWSWPQRGN